MLDMDMGDTAVSYNLRKAGTYTVIDWTGEVGLSNAPDAREQVLECLEDGQDLLLDLSKVRHIDSSGVAVLVEGHLTAKKKELHFGLVAPSRAVMNVLKLARMEQILPIHKSVESLTK